MFIVHALYAADDDIFIDRNNLTKVCNIEIDLEENFKLSIFLCVITVCKTVLETWPASRAV